MSSIDHRQTWQAATAEHGGGGHHDEGRTYQSRGSLFADVLNWATTVDHKKIGVMYLFAVLFMFFLGGMAALPCAWSCSSRRAT